MDKEKVCSIVERNADRMTVHTLCTPNLPVNEGDRQYCVLGLCFKEAGVPDSRLEDRSGPGDVYVPIRVLKDEVVEQIPEVVVHKGSVNRSWIPDEDWVSGKNILKYAYNMESEEWDELIAANDADQLSYKDIPDGDSPAERVLRYLECQEALE